MSPAVTGSLAPAPTQACIRERTPWNFLKESQFEGFATLEEIKKCSMLTVNCNIQFG
jgi:hypothetical protein